MDIQCQTLQSFCEICILLRDLDGKDVGQDPLHCIAIALQQYSVNSILRMITVVHANGIFIQHAENHEERTLELTSEDGTIYHKKMDWYHALSIPLLPRW